MQFLIRDNAIFFHAICISFIHEPSKQKKNQNHRHIAIFSKSSKMEQVNTINNEVNNMVTDEKRFTSLQKTATAATTYNGCTVGHTHTHTRKTPLTLTNNASEREKHEIINFQREN